MLSSQKCNVTNHGFALYDYVMLHTKIKQRKCFMIYVNMWNLGQICENLIFYQ